MGTITTQEMRALERHAAARGWPEESLLTHAGTQLAHSLHAFFRHPGTAIAYLGKGHNAGDAIVALHTLHQAHGWHTVARAAFPIDDWASLTRTVWSRGPSPDLLQAPPDLHGLPRPVVLLDALLGIGGSGPLRPPLTALAEEMAHLRSRHGAQVAAVDLPSGIDPDTGTCPSGTVTADLTLMIGSPRPGLLLASAADATGSLAVVPVAPLSTPPGGAADLITPHAFDLARSPRPCDFHKGNAGRVAILAGSEAFTGAAVLAACGALRGGAGLIHLHTPPAATPLIAAKSPPEIIVHACPNPADLLDSPADAIVIGPGLGPISGHFAAGLTELIARSPMPMVLDAEALNFLARTDQLDRLRANHILTPHPGEFRRLVPEFAKLPRETAARAFADRFPATLLLKGCRTLVTRHQETLWVNATGTPGMATGGQGDVLAGLIGALAAAGAHPTHAAATAAWLCGRAAEIALTQPNTSQESLTPSDVLHHLGAAFLDWQRAAR